MLKAEHSLQGFFEKKHYDVTERGPQEDINRFMSGIIKKYKLYQEQCILSWIAEISGWPFAV